MPKKSLPKYIPLETRFAKDVDPSDPLPDYPRPQLQRERWQNLNGPWDLAIVASAQARPDLFPHRIIVPFAIEAPLGGVEERLSPDQRAWYRRRFRAPTLASGERLLLHFGAVDWACEVEIDGQSVGRHRGGHVPFHFDVTDALAAEGPTEAQDEHEIVVVVHDPTDQGFQPVGKQSLDPRIIQYTAVSGIWQTVWLEPVPATRIVAVRAETRLASDEVVLHVGTVQTRPGDRIVVSTAGVEARSEAVSDETSLVLPLPGLRAWCPDDPHLYDVALRVEREGAVVDRATSYFGAREVGVGRDGDGIWRLWLNGRPVFHLGPLDQGWWPDGLYTAPTDEALVFDIEATQRMGFNTIRKHVKIEPARWYWHADRLGLLVWQDMPSPRFDQKRFFEQVVKEKRRPQDLDYDLTVSPETASAFREELDAMLDALAPFACIVTWVPFNEAWGQFDTDAVLDSVARRDPSRVVDGPSGWQDTGCGGLRDHHVYNEEKNLPPLEDDRPIVYGEFGGLKLGVEGHLGAERGWGYQDFESPEAFEEAYCALMGVIEDLVGRGLAAAIYTQTTDVESELNGLLTYDREAFKIDPDRLAAIHRRLIDRLSRSTRTSRGAPHE